MEQDEAHRWYITNILSRTSKAVTYKKNVNYIFLNDCSESLLNTLGVCLTEFPFWIYIKIIK